tara:strand:- start:119 stop:574 length:456 start_codon:yes stop_codon:yes gene_type:complete
MEFIMTTQIKYFDLNRNLRSPYYFGMDKDDFWIMFLKCHDRNNNRLDFIKDLERSILIAWGKDPSLTSLSLCWGFETWASGAPRYPETFERWFGAPHSMGYVGTYSRLRARCAKHFGVKVKKIPALPITNPVKEIRNTAMLREYFATRNLQ